MTPQRLQRLLRGRSAEEVFADLRAPRARLVPRLMHAEQMPGHRNPRTAQIVDASAKGIDRHRPRPCLGAIGGVQDGGLPPRVARTRPDSVDDRAAARGPVLPRVDRSTGRPLRGSRGTRSATHYGSAVAAELGAELSDAGVVLPSFPAWLQASTPRLNEGALTPNVRHRLSPWLVGESTWSTPPAAAGSGPAWKSPVAFLQKRHSAQRRKGGAFLFGTGSSRLLPMSWLSSNPTRAAARSTHCDGRGRTRCTVLAVPGSVRSSASEGTNSLIADGCGVARDADDVLAALELACAGSSHALGRRTGPCTQTGTARNPPAATTRLFTRRAFGAQGSRRSCNSVRARVRALRPRARLYGGDP